VSVQPQPSPTTQFTLNGSAATITAEAGASLLDVLRERLDLTGTKKGCNQGACGACTVLVDGRRVLACLTLAAQLAGRDVVTIEGVGTADDLHDLQRAFITADGFQCGYCTSGQICSALGMLAELDEGVPSAVTEHVGGRPDRTAAEVRERMSGNLCRCGAYNGIVEAIEDYAGTRAGGRS
jgi:xanthine dehydrogenase YagT iron-sulfur-binding subunit